MLTSSLQKVHKILVQTADQISYSPPSSCKQMGGEERIQNQCLFTNTLASIYTTSHTCNKILIFTNRLQVFIANTLYCKFQWRSCGYGFHLLFHNSRMSYSSSIIFDCNFDLSADHCCSYSGHLQTTTLAWSWALDPLNL